MSHKIYLLFALVLSPQLLADTASLAGSGKSSYSSSKSKNEGSSTDEGIIFLQSSEDIPGQEAIWQEADKQPSSRQRRDTVEPDYKAIFAQQSEYIDPNKFKPDGSIGPAGKLWGTRKQCISEIVRDENGTMTHVVTSCGENTSEWSPCFSGDVTMEIRKDMLSPVQTVRMDELSNYEGYLVQSAHDRWGILTNVPHHDPDMAMEFLKITLANGAELSITGNHYLYRDDGYGNQQRVLAADLKLDDKLFVQSLDESILMRSIELQMKQGIYAPVVVSQDPVNPDLNMAFYANGVLVDSMSTQGENIARQLYAFASMRLISYPKSETTRMGHRSLWKEVLLALISPFVNTQVETSAKKTDL